LTLLGAFQKPETPSQLCVLSIEPQLLYFLLLNFLSDLDSFSFAMGHQYLPNLIILFKTDCDSPNSMWVFQWGYLVFVIHWLIILMNKI
jgi:hypothetical protein